MPKSLHSFLILHGSITVCICHKIAKQVHILNNILIKAYDFSIIRVCSVTSCICCGRKWLEPQDGHYYYFFVFADLLLSFFVDSSVSWSVRKHISKSVWFEWTVQHSNLRRVCDDRYAVFQSYIDGHKILLLAGM